MSEIIEPKLLEALNALYDTYQKRESLYLDLATHFSNWHPTEVEPMVHALEARKWIEYQQGLGGGTLLCRLTTAGFEALKASGKITFFSQYKKSLAYAGGLLLVVVFALGSAGLIPTELLTGDITGTGLNESVKIILNEWIENQEQENSDHYTFSLLEQVGDRKTYLIECRDEYIDDCKYNIAFVDLDENTKKIIDVEVAREN